MPPGHGNPSPFKFWKKVSGDLWFFFSWRTLSARIVYKAELHSGFLELANSAGSVLQVSFCTPFKITFPGPPLYPSTTGASRIDLWLSSGFSNVNVTRFFLGTVVTLSQHLYCTLYGFSDCSGVQDLTTPVYTQATPPPAYVQEPKFGLKSGVPIQKENFGSRSIPSSSDSV